MEVATKVGDFTVVIDEYVDDDGKPVEREYRIIDSASKSEYFPCLLSAIENAQSLSGQEVWGYDVMIKMANQAKKQYETLHP